MKSLIIGLVALTSLSAFSNDVPQAAQVDIIMSKAMPGARACDYNYKLSSLADWWRPHREELLQRLQDHPEFEELAANTRLALQDEQVRKEARALLSIMGPVAKEIRITLHDVDTEMFRQGENRMREKSIELTVSVLAPNVPPMYQLYVDSAADDCGPNPIYFYKPTNKAALAHPKAQDRYFLEAIQTLIRNGKTEITCGWYCNGDEQGGDGKYGPIYLNTDVEHLKAVILRSLAKLYKQYEP